MQDHREPLFDPGKRGMSVFMRAIAVHLWFRSSQLRYWARIKKMALLHGSNLRHGTNLKIGSKTELQFEGKGGFVQLGQNIQICRNCIFWISDTGILEIGDGTFINNHCSIFCRSSITIGTNTLIGEGVRIYDHNHKFRNASLPIRDQGYTTENIQIGSNCWIGSGVTILKGAQIGNHCVIGAGCIIDRKIEDNTLVRPKQELQLDRIDC